MIDMSLPRENQVYAVEYDSQQVNWKSVVFFYALTLAITFPLHFLVNFGGLTQQPFRIFAIMWGPALAAIITLSVFGRQHPKTITFFGTSKLYSSLFFFLPLLILLVFRLPTASLPVVVSTIPWLMLIFLTTMGEEFGWRSFLQDALRPLSRPSRYMVLGSMWTFWHLIPHYIAPYVLESASIGDLLLTLAWRLPAAILLSWLIGEIVDHGHSWILATTFHLWMNGLWEFPSFFSMEQSYVWLAGGVIIIVWAVLLWKWPQTVSK